MDPIVLLDTEQVAERLRLSPSTLAKARMTGAGPPFVKFGSAVKYVEADLNAWLAAQPRHVRTIPNGGKGGRRRKNT